MKLVLIVIDAFRYDYLSKKNTPFLFKCSENGYYIKHLIPSAGFCERSEIFTGKNPRESGFFTAIGYDPKKSEYKDNLFLNLLGKVESLLINNYKLHKIFRILVLWFFKKYFSNKKMQPYNIPFKFLSNFMLTEDEFEFGSRNMSGSNLFSKLKEKGKYFSLNSFTSLGMPSNGNDIDRLELAISECIEKDLSFIPIYIGEIDAYGHKFGPLSKHLNSKLRDLDKKLEKTIDQLLQINNQTCFMFLGDHGMTTVKDTINIKSILSEIAKSLTLKESRDYVFFLDSTILRLWFFNKNDEENFYNKIIANKELMKAGIIIDNKIKDEFMLPKNDRRYGDIAWWANPGTLIFPDFFHIGKPYKGMHGYNPNHSSTHGTFISFGKNMKTQSVESLHLHDIYPIISNFFNEK